MFRDTFLPASGRKCLVSPILLAKAGQKVLKTVSKSGQYAAFLLIIDTENRLFDAFLPRKSDSGGPTHHFERELDSHFSRKSDEKGRILSLIKPT